MKDFHVRTCFCDGKNLSEEMVLASIKLKIKHRIGLSISNRQKTTPNERRREYAF